MNPGVKDYLKTLRQKYLLLRLVHISLLSVAVGCLAFTVSDILSVPSLIGITASIVVGVLTFIAAVIRFRLHKFDTRRILNYINQHYKELEDSADLLLLEPETLTRLEQLQQKTAEVRLTELSASIKLPHNLAKSILFFTIAVTVMLVTSAFDLKIRRGVEPMTTTQRQQKSGARLPGQVHSMNITVTPPAYMQSAAMTHQGPNVTVPEGSIVTWTIQFTDSVANVKITFSENDTVQLKTKGNVYSVTRTCRKPSLYQLHWTSAGKQKASDYYSLEIVNDNGPAIRVKDMAQFTEVKFADTKRMDLRSTLSDDYGLSDAYIIATVSKGSGESVKFREEKLTFETPASIHGKRLDAHRTIDLIRLGLEPGDELYFYIEATDNKSPLPNRTRTETYFIALADTAATSLAMDEGLGVDLMPEYFRSQRQIIIDTEKLLKEKKKITKQLFNEKSNELGYDQKVLRLKYGQFLGEEFESELVSTDENAEDAEEEDVTKTFGHVHDKENEDADVGHKETETHEHADDHKANKQEKDPLEGFVHSHDETEQATFFTRSIRAKLKAALTVMWDAELYLRLYQPEKSLPFQYKALTLLKEISNDSRIYVHKTGFDPPPLKEEKRLTGDLADVYGSTDASNALTSSGYPKLRAAGKHIEQLLSQPSPVIDAKSKNILRSAGAELSTLALAKPGRFLKALSLIKALTEEEVESREIKGALRELQIVIWQVIPVEQRGPEVSPGAPHVLEELFIDKMRAKKNER